MREALEATKELAYDCRRNGTAFRLGVMSLLSQYGSCISS